MNGNINKIDLGQSSFENLINDNNLYIDKSKFIETFLGESNSVQLIVRQRRLGKSLNLDMLRCFLTDLQDNRKLFHGLYIENSLVWNEVNSAPVFLFDFKNLDVADYREKITQQINKHILSYIDISALPKHLLEEYNQMISVPDHATGGLLLLTELVYEVTGKRSYILIDEYDKFLTDNYDRDEYEEIKSYETTLLSAGLKGNRYLKKALLTGVMRVSRESMLSGLNNLVTYDVFSDKTYADYFGLIESEILELNKISSFDKEELKSWYNGIKIKGKAIYNIYSVLSYIQSGEFSNYWGRSGTIHIILKLMNDERKEAIIKLLNGETLEAFVSRRISLNELNEEPDDSIFYSLLVQTGYLSLEQTDVSNWSTVKIPNRELMNVWKEFILSSVVKNSSKDSDCLLR